MICYQHAVRSYNKHAATGQVSMCMVVLIELDVKQILAPVYYKTKRLLVRF